MPRSIPPHLMFLIVLLIVTLWFMLVLFFRRSESLQTFVAELAGDNTPSRALREFEIAKQRLVEHLNNGDLDPTMRSQIERALEQESDEHGNG